MAKFGFMLDNEHGFLHTRYFGELCVSDIRDAVVQGNRLYPGVDSLVDFSEASLKRFGFQQIQQLVGLAKQHEPRNIRCAFVAPHNLEFGLSRMYSTIADADLPQYRAVFRSLQEARAWFAEQRGIQGGSSGTGSVNTIW